MIKKIYNANQEAACFFRSTVQAPNRKILLQITERCNLRCAHCFVDAENIGEEMNYELIKKILIPELVKSKVKKVTLTGGEPLVHKNIEDIVDALLEQEIRVSICTNGILINEEWVKKISFFDIIHFNVSLDGFSVNTHGKFRGNISQKTYDKLISNIVLLGKYNLLNGILCTPNKYTPIEEYVKLCEFSKKAGASYVLMNPLSPFGRGNKMQSLAYTKEELTELRNATKSLITDEFDIVYIRFPNEANLDVGSCNIGEIPYVFCNGDLAICPYMVFAADSETNNYNSKDFIIGNVFKGIQISDSLDSFDLSKKLNLDEHEKCMLYDRGCLAIKIANNQPLTDFDYDVINKNKI